MPDSFSSETKAIKYLTNRFTDDGPNEIARYVELLRDNQEDDGEPRDSWWKDISGDDLVEWLFNNA